MSLDNQDLEAVERLIYKNGDNVAVSIARNFERIEERVDAAESRLYTRLADIEDRVEGSRQETANLISEVTKEMRRIADE